ncbi:transposase [Trichonephila clavipes]|nr:transposase [Trichonephila clavipes]
MFPYGKTLNSDPYCPLNRLKHAIEQKRPNSANRRGVVLHQDNARSHTSIVTHQKLQELAWEVLRPLNLAPSKYQVFLGFQTLQSDRKISSREDHVNLLLEFFANRDQNSRFHQPKIISHQEMYGLIYQ